MKKGLIVCIDVVIAGVLLFVAYNHHKNKKEFEDNLARMIIGKWLTVERNGYPMLTNMSHVVTFVSPTESYTSVTWLELVTSQDESVWNKRGKSELTIKGNKISKVVAPNSHIKVVDEMEVSSITDTDLYGYSTVTTYMDGLKVTTSEFSCRYQRVAENFEDAIIGNWEGRVTSEEGSDFGDTQLHRWEFLPDGNYRYFRFIDGKWQPNDEFAEYFIDGSLLCCRWKNLGGDDQEEHREWWVVSSIENGVMNWTAFRENRDGTNYTSTLSMTKVD